MNKERKTVLHFIASNFFGGPEKQILKHALFCDKKKWRIVICTFLEGKVKNNLHKKALENNLLTFLLYTKSAYNPRVIYEFYTLLLKLKPSILVAHGYRALFICVFVRILYHAPIIAYSRGYTNESFKIRFFEALHRMFLRYCDCIISVSFGHKKVLTNYRVSTKSHIVVVHNAIEISSDFPQTYTKKQKDSIFQDYSIPIYSTLILTAGRLSPEKGHTYLLDAIPRVIKRNKHCIFALCGDGVCKHDLQMQAKRLGVEKQCLFLGFITNIIPLYTVMDLFVLPSLTEGLPNVLLESFAYAKPAIGTNVGGVPEVIADGINGLIVPSKNPIALADAIKLILDNPKKSHRMGLNGFEKVKKEFNFQSQSKQIENIYSQVIQGFS